MDFCGINEYHKMKFERIEESRKPKLVPISREMNELQIVDRRMPGLLILMSLW